MGPMHTRKRSFGGKSIPVPPPSGNAVLAWGSSRSGALCGNYSVESFFPFPQGVIALAGVQSVGQSANTAFFVMPDGSLYGCGNNSGVGTVGNGTVAADVLVPQRITGGIPLYPREELPYKKEGGGTWVQPQGPPGPVVPPIAKVSGGPGGAVWALTRDGRVMAWGDGGEGQLGNGMNTLTDRVSYEKGRFTVKLATALSTGSPTITLSVEEELPFSVVAGTTIILTSSGHGQLFTVASTAKAKTKAIPVESQTANFAYPIGTTVKPQGYWPQWAPDFVRTGGPLLVPAGSLKPDGSTYSAEEAAVIRAEANEHELTGIVDIAGAERACYMLDSLGRVWLIGQPGGTNTEYRYAELDPVWAARPGGTPKAVEVHGTHFGYLLRLADETVRYVGVNKEGTFGNGVSEEKSGVRTLATPAITEVTQVAKGEFFCIALRKDGHVWAWGSNLRGELANPSRPATSPAYEPIEVPGLPNVIEIAADGVQRQNGANNGDVAMVRLADLTVRTWGQNFTGNTGGAEGGGVKYIPWGALGDNSSENRNYPVKPNVSGITGISVQTTRMMVIKGGATPPEPSISVVVAGKLATVSWIAVAGTVGVLPVWLAPEGWTVNIGGPTAIKGPLLAANVTSWTTTTLTSGEYTAKVIESFTTPSATIVGGATKTGSGGEQTIKWELPVVPQPGWIIEGRRVGEDWHRIVPEIAGNLTEATFALPASQTGSSSETLEYLVNSAWEGSYKTRIVPFLVA